MKTVRCAIYTRKSSDEGLEQSFNSLDAQREACAAYILSQASEGWTALPEIYDDGGLSGGTLQRPALQRLLAEVAAGRVDTIVVYKVDRLTRSLFDFAKLVETFDAAGTSFVSVTQSFNTTTSMGRLTLNMLLSFAQFEREVTAERIRDKIAASKARGMWMGGTPPLGFAPDGRSLVVVEEHAALVRHLFARYLVLGTGMRIPARELESLVVERMRQFLADPLDAATTASLAITPCQFTHLHARCGELSAQREQRRPALIGDVILQVRITPTDMILTCDALALAATLGTELLPNAPSTFVLVCAARLTRSGRALRLVQDSGALLHTTPDKSLIRLLLQARRWWAVLKLGELSIGELAAREGVTSSYMTRVVRLAFLAPSITEAILDGRQRAGITAGCLTLAATIPADWREQAATFLTAPARR
jgi:DNA invertase Pin-like site-specific DNA recombinase